MLLRSLFILLFTIIAVYSCEAPRLNPLDPQNPDYVSGNKSEKTYSIKGVIRASASPFLPLAGVKVYWPNESKITQTNQLGNFSFTGIKKENGFLFYEKDGYFSDTVAVEWGDDTTYTVDYEGMIYIPTAAKFSIYTEVEYSYGPEVYRIGFDIEIVDHNGLVDSVFVSNEELGIYKNIQRQLINTYSKEFLISNLSLKSIEEAVGKDFSLIFVDNENPGNRIIAAKDKISRVIKEQNNLRSPINQDTVSSTPTFVWERIFNRGFKYHFKLEISTDEGNNSTSVFEKDDISSEDKSFELTSPIDNDVYGIDQYNWAIWCIDEYNNKVRSKQGSFIVK